MSNETVTTVKLQDPDRGWREWYIDEIYTGPAGAGRIVPNVNDKIWSWDLGTYRVTEVDYTTGLSKKVAWTAPPSTDVDATDLLLTEGPGYTSESYRLLVDKSVLPHVIQVFGSLHAYRSTASYAKVFLGTDISAKTGKVVSKYYDASGNLVGENIPLEVLANDIVGNVCIKSPKVAYTTDDLQEGELVTIVFYDDQGGVCRWAVMRVTLTGFIRAAEAPQRYITSIELICPWRSKDDPNLIEYPINVDLGSIQMLAQVNYTDGKKQVAIDGSKCTLVGLNNFVNTILGREVPLGISYALGSDESCYDMIGLNERYITASYRARTTAIDGAYSVKLFCYPCWDDANSEYVLHWYLYNLNRETWYRVDHLIEADATGSAFNGRKFGVTQEFRAALDLSKVDGRFKKWRLVQDFTVTLFCVGTEVRTLWSTSYDPSYEFPYGVEVYAKLKHISGANYRCNLASVYTNKALWLERFYYGTFPVYNQDLELRAPEPTHFVVEVAGFETEYPLAQWNQDFVIPTQVPVGQNIYLHWIRRDPASTTDLHLGVSAVSVRYDTTA